LATVYLGILAPCKLDKTTNHGGYRMNASTQMKILGAALFSATVLLAGCATPGGDKGVKVTLSGAEQNPPVTTSASGGGTITVAADKSVSGSITTKGIEATVAHIHMAPAGTNGPVIIPLTKTSDNVWSVPPGAKLTDAQYESFKAGGLYVNVHSAKHKPGEIRGQLKP
jgi:hypothetical protein